MNNIKVIVPFELIPNNDVPIIKFHLDKDELYAIVDTGAESTLFDKSIRKHLKITSEEEISIVGVSGETENAKIEIGEARLWIHTDFKQVTILNVHGYINDLGHISSHFLGDCDKKISAILGADMLNEFCAYIDFIKHEISFEL